MPQAEGMVPGECFVLLFGSIFSMFKEERRGKHGLKQMRGRRIISNTNKISYKTGSQSGQSE